MFDWVPILQYTHYFDLLVLFLVLLVVLQCFTNQVLQKPTVQINAAFGFVVTILIIFYMGLRPVHYVFGDTVTYATGFNRQAESTLPFEWKWQSDWLFYNMRSWFAKHSDIHTFFTVCSLIYCGSLWWAMKRMFKSYYYIPFLVILSMFTFWSYGVNGIRNGMGASLFILAMTYTNNLPVMFTIVLCATGMHSTVYLMIACAALAWFIKNSYYYLAGWIACVIISYFAGFTIQNFLANLPFFSGEDRFSGYLTYSHEQMVSDGLVVEMRYRWDFLLYSAMGVVVGYYFIFKRKYQDEYYHWIYNTYLATNAFWVLVIRAAYSNRFAQISWFILPIVLIYPFMKKRFWKNHELMLGYAIILFYAYTFITAFIM